MLRGNFVSLCEKLNIVLHYIVIQNLQEKYWISSTLYSKLTQLQNISITYDDSFATSMIKMQELEIKLTASAVRLYISANCIWGPVQL